MRRPPHSSYTLALRAFREMTATADGASATRARILAAANQGRRTLAGPRRVWLPTLAALLVTGTGAVAGVALIPRWRLPVPRLLDVQTDPMAWTEPSERRVSRVVPPVAGTRIDDPSPRANSEAAAYGRAHRAHFVGGDPALALAAWDEYLRRYPHGAFEPEARFNRALCLVRLGRTADAERALRPFSEGHYGDYRRAEATTLLDWAPRSPRAP